MKKEKKLYRVHITTKFQLEASSTEELSRKLETKIKNRLDQSEGFDYEYDPIKDEDDDRFGEE